MEWREVDPRVLIGIGGSMVDGVGWITTMHPMPEVQPSFTSTALFTTIQAITFVLCTFVFFSTAMLIYLSIKIRGSKNEIVEKKQPIDPPKNITESISEIDYEAWSAPMRVHDSNRLPLHRRKTRFVSVVNLKGGVGKTTLTANLAAALAREKGFQVLIVDIDFQRSLTSRCVEPKKYQALYESDPQTIRGKSVSILLDPATTAEQLLDIMLEMNKEHRVKIIPSHEFLETEDTKKQIDFLVHADHEVRFEYTRLLHQQEITAFFDFVFFDCPPRLTTSTVNALLCSDYYIIPTKLDYDSTGAVTRTLVWVEKFEAICDLHCLGVIANEVPFHGGKPLVKYKDLYDSLKRRLTSNQSAQQTFLFEHMIRESWRQASVIPGVVPYLHELIDNQFKKDIQSFMNELLERMENYEN